MNITGKLVDSVQFPAVWGKSRTSPVLEGTRKRFERPPSLRLRDTHTLSTSLSLSLCPSPSVLLIPSIQLHSSHHLFPFHIPPWIKHSIPRRSVRSDLYRPLLLAARRGLDGQPAMSLRKRPQLPATPSMPFTTDRKHLKVSASSTTSTTPSPTASTNGNSFATEWATSVSDPDDYADNSAPPTVPSTTNMKSKSTRRDSTPAADSGNRRASGRLRKPTAKAQALGGSKSYSPPLADTIIIAPITAPDEWSRKDDEPPASTVPPEVDSNAIPPEPEIPESPSTVEVTRATTPPKAGVATKDDPPVTVSDSPSRRHSQRERKPTAKLLSEATTGQKRPAPESDSLPPRKSARISFAGAKVPSKLRYSVSSSHSEDEDTIAIKHREVPAGQPSKVIVLKLKGLAEIFGPKPQPPPTKSPASAPKGKGKRKSRVQKPAPPVEVVDTTASTELPGTCNLSCLPPSSRLLAFAEIALQMPDDDGDDDEEVIPGSPYDWRIYTQLWCKCDQDEQLKTGRTNSVELARALLPNTVSQGTKYDPIDLSESQTPEAELLSTPVNTILRASDAERLSQLYTAPNGHVAGRTPNSAPVTGRVRFSRDEQSVPSVQSMSQRRVSMYEDPTYHSPFATSSSDAAKKTFEDRLREDHRALTDIRKRAAARGIPWSYNMTFDDIHALIMDAEDREQQGYQQQSAMSPPQPPTQPGYDFHEAYNSPTGFGVLLPPRTKSNGHSGSGRTRRKDSTATQTSTNGAVELTREGAGSPGFVEEGPAANSRSRRQSSPSRPKSSRFRVDPRGLRGESPGPGTIINMKDMMDKAAGLARLGKAMKKYQEGQDEAHQRPYRRVMR